MTNQYMLLPYKKNRKWRAFWLLLLLGVCCISSLPSYGQTPLSDKKKLSQYVLRGWNTEDGLSSESVSEICQSDDGYIWFGTYTGLHRFDGKDFTIYNTKNSTLPASNVLRIKKAADGVLWFGTLHGVVTYKNGEFSIPKGLEAVENFSIEQMNLTKNGSVWFSTKSNQTFFYGDGKLINFTEKLGVSKSTVTAIEEDPDGNIYFGTDDSQFIIYSPDEKVSRIELDEEVNGINTLISKEEILYVGTGRGLYTWDGDRIVKSPLLVNTTINALTIDLNNTLWLGTMRGLFRYNPSTAKLDSLTEENGIPNNIVQDLTFDNQGNLWVGTYRNGLFFLADGSITSYTKNDGLVTDIISSVTEIGDNTYLLGNENGRLNLLKNGEVSELTPSIPIPSERLKNMMTDDQGRVWISTYGGLVILDGKNSVHHTVSSGFVDNFVRVAFQDKNGTVWVGTKNAGLILFDSSIKKWRQISIDDGLSSNYVLSIEQNENGDIIVGTISGLNILRDEKVIKTVMVEDGLPSNFMFTTLSTPNYIWISSNDGLTGYSEEKIINFNIDNGMPTNVIYDVMLDDDGILWMPSENSILSVKMKELEEAAKDPEKEYSVKQYDKSYGMKNSHCLGAVLSFTDSKGNFWIPTIGGIVRINPNEIKPPLFNPEILIEDIYADNAKIPLGQQVSIPPRTDRLSIDFTGISYRQADLLQLRYRLLPFDEEWIDATEERTGLYTNLSPGTYEFQIQSGMDDVYLGTVLSREITIQAAWWQTTWAKVLFVVLIILLALLIYWIRLKNLTASNLRLEMTVTDRTRELEEQKQELKVAIDKLKSAQEQMVQSDKMASLGILSAGVAHEINNPLNFIQGGVEGLEQTLKNSENVNEEQYIVLLGAIKEGIHRASTIVNSLNEFSHSADREPEPCDIHHLIENCLTMIRYRLKHGINLVRDFTDEKIEVLGNNGKLHQAFLNIITNSIQAIDDKGEIKIATQVEKGKVIIDFIDSGEGIKPEYLTKITEPFFSTKDPGKGTGLGLSITYTIINEHKGTLRYSSQVGEGTTATITLPLLKK